MIYLKDEMERFKKSVLKHEKRWRERHDRTREDQSIFLLTSGIVLLVVSGYIGMLIYWAVP